MDNQSKQIAQYNDAFRRNAGLVSSQQAQPIPGDVVMTAGIATLTPAQRLNVMASVREFDHFTEENDPYGEHDFGSFELEGIGRILWKMDYYDPSLEYGSEDPADLALTWRILTIMLAEEY